MAIRLSGMNSGLDTDAMVQELVNAYALKKEKYVKKQTKTEWTMDAWKDVNTKVYGFYTNTLSSMRYSSSYNLRKASISNSSIAQVSASNGAVTSTQSLAVKQLASSAYFTGGEIKLDTGARAKSATKLSDLGITEGTIMVGDTKVQLKGDMSLASLSAQIKGADVNASFDEGTGRFFVSAKTSGVDQEFTITAGDGNGLAALEKLGLATYTDVDGNESAEMKRYREIAGGSYSAEDAIDEKYDAKKWTTASYKTSIESKVASATKSIESLNKSNEELQKRIDELKKEDYADETAYNEAKAKLEKKIEDNNKSIAENQSVIDENQPLLDDPDKLQAKVDELNADILAGIEKDVNSEVAIAQEIVRMFDEGSLTNSTDSARITARDAIIKLNGATFTSNTNSFSINGLNINATATTVTTTVDDQGNIIEQDNAVTINTAIDTQGIYDKIVAMFDGYNELIGQLDSLYYAESAEGYEPLSDDEKEAMTEKQIEDWEEKAKSALLRRDSTLGAISSSLKSSILGTSITVDGVEYSLSSFGIGTGSYFNTNNAERGKFHIDGNKNDASVSNNEDKLMSMISSDPDTAIRFFQELSNKMYDTLTKKMASSSLSSAFTIYNDKQMSSQYSDYKDKVEEWEEKLEKYEESWHKKFSAMETALSKLQSQSSQLAGLLGQSA